MHWLQHVVAWFFTILIGSVGLLWCSALLNTGEEGSGFLALMFAAAYAGIIMMVWIICYSMDAAGKRFLDK